MNKIKWSEHYKEMTERNIGLISVDEQDQIRNTHIALFGVGGMGSRIAEILVRSGCQKLTIVDRDMYSVSNLSTQPITKDDIRKLKVDVLAEKFKNINPEISIRTFNNVTMDNITMILENVKVQRLS